MNIIHHYNTDHNTTSAKEIVPYIFDILTTKPKSVIDVGCGLAQWLKVFQDFRIEEVLGVDGCHVPLDRLNISASEFFACDLKNFDFDFVSKRFDLLLSLEVAEHLEEPYAYKFVETLTKLSDQIIFAAAVPNQTGENHFNEQYPDYWESIFKEFGYSFLDPFRQKFWRNEKVNWWYRQNMFLVVKDELKENYNFPYNGNIYIHPKLLELQASINASLSNQKLSVRQQIKILFKSLLGKYK
jgi:SAM-dependent methyltransferase